MQGRGIRDGTVRVVGSDAHQVGLTQACDPARLEQPAAVTDVRLKDVASLELADPAKLPASGQAFARCDGHPHAPSHLEQCVRLLGRHRLLAKEWMKFLDGPDVFDGLYRGRPTVKVHHDVHAVAHRFTELFHHPGKVVYGGEPHQRLGERNDDHFHRAVPFFNHRARSFDERSGFRGLIDGLHFPPAEVRVHPDPVSHSAAQQFIDGDAERLSQDIPARLLDAGEGGHPDRADSPKGVAVEDLPEELDSSGVAAEEHGFEVLDASDHAARLPFERRLSPAIKARLVSLYLDEYPVAHDGVDNQRFNVSDFHGGPTLSGCGGVPTQRGHGSPEEAARFTAAIRISRCGLDDERSQPRRRWYRGGGLYDVDGSSSRGRTVLRVLWPTNPGQATV